MAAGVAAQEGENEARRQRPVLARMGDNCGEWATGESLVVGLSEVALGVGELGRYRPRAEGGGSGVRAPAARNSVEAVGGEGA